MYSDIYGESYAIIIGINKYVYASPLRFAVNDAQAVFKIFNNNFGFNGGNIDLLLDNDASRERILSTFLELARKTRPDDRVLFFFAGHGFTQRGHRGEIGFLVPNDGDPDNLSTLVRWDEITRNAELVPAKHMLFIMDACYGGLALTRQQSPGSVRFLKDMLQRFSRQVLTAGKADEVVSDSGGPREGHSVFTGHLIDAFDGAAKKSHGIISANGVMSYVYEKVSADYDLHQTPHYGFLDGDGDFIFNLAEFENSLSEDKTGKDILYEGIQYRSDKTVERNENLSRTIKEYLSEAKHQIALHDVVSRTVKRFLTSVREANLEVQVGHEEPNAESFAKRLEKYEECAKELLIIIILIGRWATGENAKLIEQIISRASESVQNSGGFTAWLGLQWYPISLLMYGAGIAAISGKRYENLHRVFHTRLFQAHDRARNRIAVISSTNGILDVTRANLFKEFPGHERYYAPFSEYMFKRIQSSTEDQLFLGNIYEGFFDEFEIFLALTFAHETFDERDRIWGPPGRFAWKFLGGRSNNPFSSMMQEFETKRETWPPLTNGFFGGSADRFQLIAEGYRELIKGLHWH